MKKYTFMRITPRVIALQFESSPGMNWLNQLLAVLHALTWVGGILATQKLFDAISTVGSTGLAVCVAPLALLAAVSIGQQIFSGVWNFLANNYLTGKAISRASVLLHDKLGRIDPAKFEDTIFLDDLNKAREGIKVLPYFCNIVLQIVTFHFVYFALIGAYFFTLTPLLVLALALSFIPALLGQMLRVRVFGKLEAQAAPLRREYEYYQKTLCDREYFKETRILGAFQYFHRMFTDCLSLFVKKSWRAERMVGILFLLLNLTTFAGMAASAVILFRATMSGAVTVGAFAAVFAALSQLFNLMNEVVAYQLGNVNRNAGKVANFARMLDEEERTGAEGEHDFTKGVRAENVSFVYPGRAEPSVRNISLEIRAGETIAIVGENGAGKSTLVRLLTGLYRPSEGRVLVGGLDTSLVKPEAVYKNISGVFQKYQRYKMTLRENVSISRADFAGSYADAIDAKISAALKEAGAELPEDVGLDTMLSPEFDGVDLSGGQWQRVAIARGLYRASGFIVLDEPTAAIDPIEETKVYRQFQKLAKGKCAVVVTHRLGSARLAHRVIVMDAGKIVEVGTHEELLARPGKYAEMWGAQAQWYERETK